MPILPQSSFPSGLNIINSTILKVLYGELPTRVIMINEVADFPEPILGVIYLEDRVQYLIGDNIALGSLVIVMDAFTVIRGVDVDNARLSHTGAGPFITATNVTWSLEHLTLSAPSGQIFAHSDTDGEFIRWVDVQVSNAQTLGTFHTDGGGVMLVDTFIAESLGDGLTFSGSWNILQMSIGSQIQFSGTFIDLGTATFDSIGIETFSLFLVTSSSTFITGLANSGNINAGGLARVVNCALSNIGGGTILSGVSVDDARWRFTNNQNIRDSRPDGLNSISGNSTATDIVTQSVPVKVGGTWLPGHVSQFEADTTGRLTYIGDVQYRMPIDAVINVQKVSGNAVDVILYIAINGAIISATSSPIVDVSANRAKRGSTMWQYSFTNGDYVEIWVSNTGGTGDLIITDAILRIN